METQERTAHVPFEVEGWRAPARWPERAAFFVVGMVAGVVLTIAWALS